jgi:hypothetical protein
MLGKNIRSKLKAGIAATCAAGLVILVATGAQAKGGNSAHHQNTDAQDHHTSQKAVGVHYKSHHHKKKVADPVHGEGSSHNPIVTPTGTPPTGTTIVRDHRGGGGDPVVRDHRDGDTVVRDHRGDPSPTRSQPPPCLTNCATHQGRGRGSPDVRDHRPIPCLGNLC